MKQHHLNIDALMHDCLDTLTALADAFEHASEALNQRPGQPLGHRRAQRMLDQAQTLRACSKNILDMQGGTYPAQQP